MTALLAALLLAPPGLKIEDQAKGKGDEARPFDLVTVEYTGKLTSGKQFDSSRGRAPFPFLLGAGQVIKGWDLGVIGMKVGGKRRLTISPELGYGKEGAGDDIPPNATLVFDVEVLKISRAKIEVLTPGKGRAAEAGDRVFVHYRGALKGEKKPFDESKDRGPFEVDLARPRVIPGFAQGVFGIRVGEKRRVTIPPDLGYGAKGAGGVIPPNATLVFDLTGVSVEKGE